MFSDNVAKLTNSTEDNARKGVAKDELQNTTDHQEHATKESDRATVELIRWLSLRKMDGFSLRERDSVSTGASPGH